MLVDFDYEEDSGVDLESDYSEDGFMDESDMSGPNFRLRSSSSSDSGYST